MVTFAASHDVGNLAALLTIVAYGCILMHIVFLCIICVCSCSVSEGFESSSVRFGSLLATAVLFTAEVLALQDDATTDLALCGIGK